MLLTLQTRLWTAYASFVFEFRCYVRHVMLLQVDIEYCRASTGSWVPVIIVGLLDSLLRGFFWVSCRLWSTHVTQDFCVMRLPPRIASACSCWSAHVEQLNLHHATRTAEQPPFTMVVRDLRLHVTSWWRHGFFGTRRRLHLLPRGVQHVHRYAVGFWFWSFFLFTRWDVPNYKPF